MPAPKHKIILDTNIWISFTIGKKLSYLSSLLNSPSVNIYGCEELITEYVDVVRRPKLSKLVTEERVVDTLDLIFNTTIFITITQRFKIARDVDDNYLLALAKQVGADFLVTGDKDLLVLEKFQKTQIITFNELVFKLK